MRDDFTEGTKRVLAARVGYKCSRCGASTSGPQIDPSKAVNVGVAGHITGASPKGPRYDPLLTTEERRSPQNGIWLCQSCGKLVDNDLSQYTAGELRDLKLRAEADAERTVGRSIPAPTQGSRAGWEIFDELRGIRDRITGSAVPTLQDISSLHRIREKSELMFGEALSEYVRLWIRHAAALHTGHAVLANPESSDEERHRWIEADYQALLFFADQYEQLARTLRPYVSS